MNKVEKFYGKKINFQILEDGVRSRKKNMMSEVEKEKLSETWIGGARGGVDTERTSSKRFYYSTKQHVLDKKAQQLSEAFENVAKSDHEVRAQKLKNKAEA